MISNFADLMCHRAETASKCYRMVHREKTCVAAAKKPSDITGMSIDQKYSVDNRTTETYRADETAARAVWSKKEVKDSRAWKLDIESKRMIYLMCLFICMCLLSRKDRLLQTRSGAERTSLCMTNTAM